MLAAARPTTTLSMVPTSNVRSGTSPVAVDDHSVITSAGVATRLACIVDAGDDADPDQLVGPPGVLRLVERGAEKLDAARKVVVQRVANVLHIGRLQPCSVGGASASQELLHPVQDGAPTRVDDS